MGQSTDAQLDYGYDLGSAGGFRTAEWDSDEWALKVAWYDTGSDKGFAEQAYNKLYEAVALPEDAFTYDFERQDAAEERLGVTLSAYGSCDVSSWVLTTDHTYVSRGACKVIDPAELIRKAQDGDYNTKLQRALGILGLHPTQQAAGWILTSMWC